MMMEATAERNELAHAIYTVAMHLSQGATELALDRIRGAAANVPALLEEYPQLREVLGL